LRVRLRPIAAPTPRVLPVTWASRPFSFAPAGGHGVSRVSKVVVARVVQFLFADGRCVITGRMWALDGRGEM
jgi:hypothetical protein